MIWGPAIYLTLSQNDGEYFFWCVCVGTLQVHDFTYFFHFYWQAKNTEALNLKPHRLDGFPQVLQLWYPNRCPDYSKRIFFINELPQSGSVVVIHVFSDTPVPFRSLLRKNDMSSFYELVFLKSIMLYPYIWVNYNDLTVTEAWNHG